ncbi:acyl-CoA dehydrogenase family protein [Peptoniphilus stercorisuis]|uniref:Butyryl-CoA dehydrogenase n=1 Tax=Peptoniphilus stercorisuis TaxID=1436965 RepID=A0ABS4KCN0_9FIRM|nr:acyl-CoA dehydrogenase family protein [Peptoniphilus stercorisuis]MBP2025520.1 butyryl-CoA dehydrogenase [Peptoniphilus stercorisuis]
MFELTGKYKLVQQMAKEFAEKEIKPIAQEIDENERFPEESIPKLFKAGIMGSQFPEEFGGEGGDTMSYVIALEEIGKVCATTATIVSIHSSIGINLLIKYGNKEQQEKYLPILTSKGIAAFLLTEPQAGTDATNQKTTAIKDGDYYIINGRKMFISNAGHNDLYIVIAVTDADKGTKGITAFLVEPDNPGIRVGKPLKKMGIRGSSTSAVFLKDCKVHKDSILGNEGDGIKIALGTLDTGRIGIAAESIGIAQGALDEAIKYVNKREQFNQKLSAFQNTQFKIADMQTKIDAGRLLIWRAATLKDDGKNYAKEAAMAKLYCSEIANDSTRLAVQLFGGYGYLRGNHVERMMRDAKITEIYEGTSEAQKIVISRFLGVK